jgi:hypothetical protein
MTNIVLVEFGLFKGHLIISHFIVSMTGWSMDDPLENTRQPAAIT